MVNLLDVAYWHISDVPPRHNYFRFRMPCRRDVLAVSLSVRDPGCVKTRTAGKCGKYNSPTRYRSACAQHDLTLTMRNFSKMLLRAQRAPEFSHGQDPERPLAGPDRAPQEAPD
jgi:hypothetical protein